MVTLGRAHGCQHARKTWPALCILSLVLFFAGSDPAAAEPPTWRAPSWSVTVSSADGDPIKQTGVLTDTIGPGVLCVPTAGGAHAVIISDPDGTLRDSWAIQLPVDVSGWHGLQHKGLSVLLLRDHSDPHRVEQTLVATVPSLAPLDTLAEHVRSVEILRGDVWRVSVHNPAIRPEIWTATTRISIEDSDVVTLGDSTLFRAAFTQEGPDGTGNLRLEELDLRGRSLRIRDVAVQGVATNIFLDEQGAVWRNRNRLTDVKSTRLVTVGWTGRPSSVALRGAPYIVDVSARWILLSERMAGNTLSHYIRDRDQLKDVRFVQPPMALVTVPILWRDSILCAGVLSTAHTTAHTTANRTELSLVELALDGSLRAEFLGHQPASAPGSIWMTSGKSPAPVRLQKDWLLVESPGFELVAYDLRRLHLPPTEPAN